VNNSDLRNKTTEQLKKMAADLESAKRKREQERRKASEAAKARAAKIAAEEAERNMLIAMIERDRAAGDDEPAQVINDDGASQQGDAQETEFAQPLFDQDAPFFETVNATRQVDDGQRYEEQGQPAEKRSRHPTTLLTGAVDKSPPVSTPRLAARPSRVTSEPPSRSSERQTWSSKKVKDESAHATPTSSTRVTASDDGDDRVLSEPGLRRMIGALWLMSNKDMRARFRANYPRDTLLSRMSKDQLRDMTKNYSREAGQSMPTLRVQHVVGRGKRSTHVHKDEDNDDNDDEID